MKPTQYDDANLPPPSTSGIAARIIACTCLMFIAIIIVVSAISYGMYKEAFYNYGNALCLSSNAQAAYAINGDLVQRFARTLEADAEYERFAAGLDALSSKINAKYFYILTDTGVPGMYTYIYDAHHSAESTGEKYALGRNETKEEYKGADEVMRTGKGFTKAEYYNDSYGELYYAYAPIFNARGDVVAFLGTDVDISPLHEQVSRYRETVFGTLAVALAVFSAVYFLIVRRMLTRPLLHITASAFNLARGDLNLQISRATLARRDEIGRLAEAFETVARRIEGVGRDIERLMQAVRDGRLGERADLSAHQGDYYRIIAGVNSTLDVVGRHLDVMPEAVAFFDAGKNLLYGNRTMRAFIETHCLGESGDALLARLFSARSEADQAPGQSPDQAVDPELLFREPDTPSLSMDIRLKLPDSDETRNYSAMLLHAGTSAPDTGERRICVMLVLADTTQLGPRQKRGGSGQPGQERLPFPHEP